MQPLGELACVHSGRSRDLNVQRSAVRIDPNACAGVDACPELYLSGSAAAIPSPGNSPDGLANPPR